MPRSRHIRHIWSRVNFPHGQREADRLSRPRFGVASVGELVSIDTDASAVLPVIPITPAAAPAARKSRRFIGPPVGRECARALEGGQILEDLGSAPAQV